MMTTLKSLWAGLAVCLVSVPVFGQPARSVEIEAGWLRAGRADVRIPGDTGTRFSLTDDLDAGDTGYARLRLAWRSAPRHHWLATLVPLEVSATGDLAQDTQYVDTLFPAGTPVKATYRFNNYRLSYRYRVHQTERVTAELGATLFIRDARVELRSDTLKDSKSDLGLVPLVSFRLAWQCLEKLAVVVDGDALAAPQGRALDVLLGLEYDCRDRIRLAAGYRILEGGADNDDVYTFALFHHAALRASWLF